MFKGKWSFRGKEKQTGINKPHSFLPIPLNVIPPINKKNPYIYLFVRQDISLAQQVVQSNHATWESSRHNKKELPIANMVLIGVPNELALRDVAIKLMDSGIKFNPFFEPDNQMGLSAITTEPITDRAKRLQLMSYNLWTPENTHVGEIQSI